MAANFILNIFKKMAHIKDHIDKAAKFVDHIDNLVRTLKQGDSMTYEMTTGAANRVNDMVLEKERHTEKPNIDNFFARYGKDLDAAVQEGGSKSASSTGSNEFSTLLTNMDEKLKKVYLWADTHKKTGVIVGDHHVLDEKFLTPIITGVAILHRLVDTVAKNNTLTADQKDIFDSCIKMFEDAFCSLENLVKEDHTAIQKLKELLENKLTVGRPTKRP